MAQARNLMRRTGASTLVVTISVDPRTGEEYRKDFCDPSPHWKVICLVPDPYTTRGEAATLRDLAARHHWSDAVVLTDPPHVTRTRMWMDRCAAPRHRRRVDGPGFPARQSSEGRLPVGWMGRGTGAELSVNRSPRRSLPMMTIEASISRASRSEDPMSATPHIGIILGSTCPGRVRDWCPDWRYWSIVRREAGSRKLCGADDGCRNATSHEARRAVRSRRYSSGWRPSRQPECGERVPPFHWSAADTAWWACA